MFNVVVILVLAAVATADFPLHDGRIVGGEDTTIEAYPHQVSLQSENLHYCGGSIVTSKHVVTAAHCVIGRTPSFTTVRESSTHREEGGKVHATKSIVWHPKFTIFSLNGDVGIITLDEPIIFSETAKAIKLRAINTETDDGELLSVTGWGITKAGILPKVLQVVKVPAVSRDKCVKAHSTGTLRVTPLMMCAGITEKDSCQGDSGGPLINKNQELVGIVSWGNGCGKKGYPGVYTNVANPIVHNFITNHTNEGDY